MAVLLGGVPDAFETITSIIEMISMQRHDHNPAQKMICKSTIASSSESSLLFM
jgi:hypothetical protein